MKPADGTKRTFRRSSAESEGQKFVCLFYHSQGKKGDEEQLSDWFGSRLQLEAESLKLPAAALWAGSQAEAGGEGGGGAGGGSGIKSLTLW